MTSIHAAALVSLAALASGPAHAQQGVTPTEILLGSILDLSGPVAAMGKPARNGMLMRLDEINEQGGIHGRKLRMIVEDDGYDPKKAVLAAQKLVNRDKVFLVAGHLGTAQNMAAMPVQFEKNVINFYPLTAAREMYEPLHRLKYSFAATYYDQVRLAAPRLVADKGARKVCTVYQDDDFGLEVLRGAEAGLQAVGKDLVEKTTYKRGATDFSSQVARLKAASCDFVILGTTIRETVGVMAESRKSGFEPIFLSTSASYTEVVTKLGGKAVEGLLTTMTAQHPYLDDASGPLRLWANKYKTRFGDDPNVFSVYGYVIVDHFAQAANKAGKALSTDSFIQAMDAMRFEPDMFGFPVISFSAQKRLGSDESRLSQVVDGRWKVVSGYAR
ncbi:Leu/Ile/Val/Thr-binding protein precursor [Delftia tsuruhatensis]|uniref:ABC transporter substrate-binding protein n=1 Tax=Delftia tsuruhatensis TaxID=180282 RepID=UPI001E709CE3|nr:ABC transporter substrate-binding protein [Delftia tsuruhatensis]CAB5690613.1 Leu/Ile/Val/Thr-binding protein precursor [Delftia tsuruhatensis]CAC9677002.1 Leu/Ile/Val/Thr-binding protein precursor [Delftia tsuruhatensis]